VLIGLMGVGKSSVGHEVAAKLGRPFVDTDLEVEERTGRRIAALFAAEGEAVFRRHESAVLAAALDHRPAPVVAAGGGLVVSEANRALLARRAVVVWLHASPEVLARRVGDDPDRPLLGDDPVAALTRLEAERRPLYDAAADMAVDVDGHTVAEVAALVVEALGRWPASGDVVANQS
jgi:shikimate kinase